MNLYEKIIAITDSLGVIQKDSQAPQAMGGFKFLSHAMVLAHLRTELVKHKVLIIPAGNELVKSETYHYKNAKGEDKQTIHTLIRFVFEVIDAEEPGTSFKAAWYGEGHDNSDKGVQKAGTSAEKYFLMKLFKIGDKDDPDGADNQGQDASSTKAQSVSATLDPAKGAQWVKDAEKYAEETLRARGDLPPADEKATDVPVDQVPANTAQNQAKADAIIENNKARQEALFWLGEQLPPTAGWFKGKIVPLVQLFDNQKKAGKLKPEQEPFASGVDWVFDQIMKTHLDEKYCGSGCQHLLAAKVAILMNGKITDPGEKSGK